MSRATKCSEAWQVTMPPYEYPRNLAPIRLDVRCPGTVTPATGGPSGTNMSVWVPSTLAMYGGDHYTCRPRWKFAPTGAKSYTMTCESAIVYQQPKSQAPTAHPLDTVLPAPLARKHR